MIADFSSALPQNIAGYRGPNRLKLAGGRLMEIRLKPPDSGKKVFLWFSVSFWHAFLITICIKNCKLKHINHRQFCFDILYKKKPKCFTWVWLFFNLYGSVSCSEVLHLTKASFSCTQLTNNKNKKIIKKELKQYSFL